MATRFLRIGGGQLEAVRRGPPPPAPMGYEQSKFDKYVFIPTLTPCEFREEQQEVNSSCGCSSGTVLYCNHFKYKVLPQECRKCPLRKQ